MTKLFTVRAGVRWLHLWMGLIVGLFICLLGVTGTVVTFRPQIANLLSPAAVSANGCAEATDWNSAEREIQAYTGSTINRIYFPADSDPRVQMRIMASNPKVYRHITFDGCAGRVLGETSLGWMYWMVDLHHNLLADNAGRRWVGAIGIVLLLSSLGGLLLWLLARPNLRTMFLVRRGRSNLRTSMDLHRAVGLAVMPLLLLPAFTGIWLCYQQPMRSMLALVLPIAEDVRVPRPKGNPPPTLAGLGDIIQAARQAIPDGKIQEIRLPEGYGNVQVRMWRAGDFRSLGNNVVTVNSANAQVLNVDLYDGKPTGNRFIQAMAGLHYGEWGGLAFRTVYGIAGLTTLLLFVTGFLMWWLPKRRRSSAPSRVPSVSPDQVAVSN